MDDILGIVEDDRLGAAPVRRLVGEQRPPQPVEAIGLGRRARPAADHDPHPRVRRPIGGGRRRRGVVGIGADIDAPVALAPGGDGGAKHRADHRRLVPGGHEHGEQARPRRRRQVGDGSGRGRPTRRSRSAIHSRSTARSLSPRIRKPVAANNAASRMMKSTPPNSGPAAPIDPAPESDAQSSLSTE